MSTDVRRHCRRLRVLALVIASPPLAAAAGEAYLPCDAAQETRTVTLTGRDLTIEEIESVARHGAHVALSADARRQQADRYGLLIEATAEGLPIYWFNRGTADNRETVMFSGDVMSAENRPRVLAWQAERFRHPKSP